MYHVMYYVIAHKRIATEGLARKRAICDNAAKVERWKSARLPHHHMETDE